MEESTLISTEFTTEEAPLIVAESPLAPEAQTTSRAIQISGSNDWYGACSVKQFLPGVGNLQFTEDDARGWLDFVTQHQPANFWLGEAGVQAWLYEPPNDNYQDTYGADAVLAFYHSGHGVTDSNGVFQAPLGSVWDGKSTAFSNRMMLGNDQAKYIFWSTCFSLRVFGDNNPVRTWHPANGGLRMIFGYETVSIDDPNYGKFFWEEWGRNKSFSQAWIDAGLRINGNNQIASVCACGANAEDARNRLYNERLFYATDPGRAFYQWRWTDAGSSRNLSPAVPFFPLPSQLLVAEFEPINQKDQLEFAAQVADAFNIGNKKRASVNPLGNILFRNGQAALTVNSKDNRFDAVLAKPNYENKSQISTAQVQGIAERLLQDHNLTKNMDLELFDVRYGFTAGGSPNGSGSLDEPYITDTTLEFRQMVNGLPAISPDAGILRITVDNDGKVTNVRNSLRPIARMSDKPKSMSLAPPDSSSRSVTNPANPPSMQDLEMAFEAKLNQLQSGNEKTRSVSSTAQITSTEIGYDFSKSHGSIVASRLYELDMGEGFKKLYKVNVPIFE